MIKKCFTCYREYTRSAKFCPHDGQKLTVLNQDPMIGVTLGKKYLLKKLIKVNLEGKIYLADHTYMETPVLVKLLVLHEDPSKIALDAIRKDIHQAIALQHPNVMKILDFSFTNSNVPYLVTEKVIGSSLTRFLRQNKTLPLDKLLRILKPVCEVLHEAHQNNFLHRHLSPNRVILSDIGNDKEDVKVVFPIGLTSNDPRYMSPEQAQGQELTPSSDIYSLGAILYKALTGKVLFSNSSFLSLIYDHVNRLPMPLRFLNPNIPSTLCSVVLKAISKNPEHRQKSVLELLDQVEDALATTKNTLPAKRSIISNYQLAF
ncbi:MAG: serine/threonine-protein kinase [Blastocatellia bacterium]